MELLGEGALGALHGGTGLKRVSKPGLRVYAGADELPRVLRGLGIAIVSTSKGVMTDKKAREAHVGGEVLCMRCYLLLRLPELSRSAAPQGPLNRSRPAGLRFGSMINKQQAEPKFSSRRYNRCKICGRPHAYLRNYGICRTRFAGLRFGVNAAPLGRFSVETERYRGGYLAPPRRGVTTKRPSGCDAFGNLNRR